MGQISDQFGGLQFSNEAEVSQNFLMPFLINFLGYRSEEILPERQFNIAIPLNRSRSIGSDSLRVTARPDFVVTLAGRQNVFVCDSKGPDENLDDYLDQLRAYAIAATVDLLLITNGNELRVYNANTLLCDAQGIDEIDLSFQEIYKLLGREPAERFSAAERYQSLNLSVARNLSQAGIHDENQRRIAVALSDYRPYLNQAFQQTVVLELPSPLQEAFGINLRRLPAEDLYTLQDYHGGSMSLREQPALAYESLFRVVAGVPILILGESGIGKTTLLRQLFQDHIQRCLSLRSDRIPVLVSLGLYGPNQSVMKMVETEMASKGAIVATNQIGGLLRSGRLVLLLDGFDEVLDAQIPDVERELQLLVQSFHNCRIYITSRPFRLPRLAPIRRYSINPLSPHQMLRVAELYLPDTAHLFQTELRAKGLIRLASNTLVLTLLVLIFQQAGQLPGTLTAILRAIVGKVQSWDAAKQARFAVPLVWDTIESFLAQLAIRTIERGTGYVLDAESVDSAISTAFQELRARNKIPQTITSDQVLSILSSTGFVSQAQSNIAFWHQAFAEYFALPELARRLQAEPEIVSGLIGMTAWERILPMAIAQLEAPFHLVERILPLNVFTAASTILECEKSNDNVLEVVTRLLAQKANSPQQPIRRLALTLLRQIHGPIADDLIFGLLNSPYVDVQKTGLIETARRKLPGARDIVFSRLSWNDPTASIWDGGSGTAVIEALAEFDDLESQLRIVELWRERRDIFTAEACYVALTTINNRGVLARETKDALLEFFLANDRNHFAKHPRLGNVLKNLHDPAIAERLLEELSQGSGERLMRAFDMVEILASFHEAAIVDRLVLYATDSRLSNQGQAWFARILTISAGEIPVGIFERLAGEADDEVRAHGIRGLGRFNFEQARDLVLRAVHPPEYEANFESGFSYARVQEAAFEVLAKHDQLELLLDPANRAEYMYNISADVLFGAVSTKRLTTLGPLVESYLAEMQDPRTRVRAAWTLAELGQTDVAQRMVEQHRQSGGRAGEDALDLLGGIHLVRLQDALPFIDDVLQANLTAQDGNSLLLVDHCIEALERIGTAGAVDRLAQLVLATVDDVGGIVPERALRAIETLAPRDRETWVIELVEKYPVRGILHRALDTLGVLGTEASLPILHKYLDGDQPEHIRTFAYRAIESIHRRSGRLWFNNEERSD